MDENHIEVFIKLSSKYPVDIGFLVIRSLVVIQQLFVDVIKKPNVDLDMYEKISSHYEKLDKQIEKLFRFIEPEHYIFVSDHGQSIKKYSVNINKYLEKYIDKKIINKKKIFYLKFKHFCKKFISKKIFNSFKNLSFLKHRIDLLNNQSEHLISSKCFAFRYIPGIYINDKISTQEKEEIKNKILMHVNNYEEFKKIGIFAKDVSEVYPISKFPNRSFLPNLILTQPSDVFFENNGEIIQQNKMLYKKKIAKDIISDQHVGAKNYKICAFGSINIDKKDNLYLFEFINEIKNRIIKN